MNNTRDQTKKFEWQVKLKKIKRDGRNGVTKRGRCSFYKNKFNNFKRTQRIRRGKYREIVIRKRMIKFRRV